MKLVVGLGNPGAKYETTRHNAGFLAVDLLVDESGAAWSAGKGPWLIAKGQLLGESFVFLKPQTFMNLSGRAVVPVLNYFKIAPSEMVVVYDDIDLDFAQVKARDGGGHGGHNGVRSILSESGENGFHRIKLGVGRPGAGDKTPIADWVLQPFTDSQLLELQDTMYPAIVQRIKSIFRL